MPTITYTITTDQMDEIKAAIQHARGPVESQYDITDEEVKAWGLGHFQQIVQQYRQSLINANNPVSTAPVAS